MPPGGPLRWERRVRWIGGIGLVVILATLFFLVEWGSGPRRDGVIDLVARQPGAGGWSLPRIVVNQGERVRLRIHSEDVVHGFAIGRMGVDAGPIEPGKAVTVEFVASQPGEYTFYCTTWCDPNHPRMRGTLEVRPADGAPPPRAPAAQDVTLAHLDDPRDAGVIPAARPSARRGADLYARQCATCHGTDGTGTPRGEALVTPEVLQDRSPVAVFRFVRGEAGEGWGGAEARRHGEVTHDWPDQSRWDVVAYLWSLGTTPGQIERGRQLFTRNCAACHGEQGAGDGPGGRYQPTRPANFTKPRTMLAGSSRLYTAKIRRGGMGTGMPYWGSIFTEEEMEALVSYVWTFSMGTNN
jgi:cytochrome c oxidase subunit 2